MCTEYHICYISSDGQMFPANVFYYYINSQVSDTCLLKKNSLVYTKHLRIHQAMLTFLSTNMKQHSELLGKDGMCKVFIILY